MGKCDVITANSKISSTKTNPKRRNNILKICGEVSCQHFSDQVPPPSQSTSTCLVVFWEEFNEESSSSMKVLCDGRKKCIAMTLLDSEEDINIPFPLKSELPSEKKFSIQNSWVAVKKSRSGHIVKLSCRGNSVTWLQKDKDGNLF